MQPQPLIRLWVMTDDEGSMIRRRRIGQLLRNYREAAGLTTAQVGAELECSGAKISRLETAKSPLQRRDVRDMLELYDVSEDERQEVMALLRDANNPGWWDEYTGRLPAKYSTFIGYEEAAATCRTYEPQVIPGLLQTRDYAQATIRKTLPDAVAADVDARVEVRMQRQKVLLREDPLRLSVVVCEAALRRQVASPAVMKAQRRHLIDTATALPNVRLQVHPFNRGPLACTTGPFVLIEFRDSNDRGSVYMENAAGDLYLEKPRQIDRYRLLFEELSADALGADETVEFIRRIDRET